MAPHWRAHIIWSRLELPDEEHQDTGCVVEGYLCLLTKLVVNCCTISHLS